MFESLIKHTEMHNMKNTIKKFFEFISEVLQEARKARLSRIGK
jgi:preprotein translocase subunit SecE